MEPILKIWYETMKNDRKILGLKCKRCGTVMFPPVPVCGACSCMETEWVEMSGKGEMYALGYSPNGTPPYYDDPTVFCNAKLEEGMIFAAPLKGAKRKQIAALEAQTPVPVHMEVQDLDDTVAYPRFVLDEEGQEA